LLHAFRISYCSWETSSLTYNSSFRISSMFTRFLRWEIWLFLSRMSLKAAKFHIYFVFEKNFLDCWRVLSKRRWNWVAVVLNSGTGSRKDRPIRLHLRCCKILGNLYPSIYYTHRDIFLLNQSDSWLAIKKFFTQNCFIIKRCKYDSPSFAALTNT
jgi:hypothetical protein